MKTNKINEDCLEEFEFKFTCCDQYVSAGTPFTKSNVDVETDFDDISSDGISEVDVKDAFTM